LKSSGNLTPSPAERDLGLKMGKVIGGSGRSDWSCYTFQIESGSFESWRGVLARRLVQPAEEAYLERGALEGEPGFSGLNADSTDEVLRRWAFAYYAANGITDDESLREISGCDRAYFVALAIRLLKNDLGYRDDVAVRAYIRALKAGVEFPPLIVRRAHNRYHVLEGFHRLAAYSASRWTNIPCVILGRNLPRH
jgi:hypothetical protein